jgi:mRNA interferase HigB
VTAKLAVYDTMRARGRSKLAKKLGMSENSVRRLLDLRHSSHVWIIDEALSKMNAELQASLLHWYQVTSRAADWKSTNDVQKALPHAKVLNAERVRFEIAYNTFRLIVAFNFRAQITFIKFVGSHAEYNKVDALTVSQF